MPHGVCNDLGYGATGEHRSADVIAYCAVRYAVLRLRCAVLSEGMMLRLCYEMSGNDLGYGATGEHRSAGLIAYGPMRFAVLIYGMAL